MEIEIEQDQRGVRFHTLDVGQEFENCLGNVFLKTLQIKTKDDAIYNVVNMRTGHFCYFDPSDTVYPLEGKYIGRRI